MSSEKGDSAYRAGAASPLANALSYIERGWPVFPCRAREMVDEHTGEVLAPKTPMTSNGFRGASLNQRIINEWWRRTPDAMVGIPTGRAIKAWVLDIDIKEMDDGTIVNGYDTLAALEEQYGPLPPTARVATPRGGTHYYFTHVEGVRNRGAFGAGIDVRGEGGFVIAAGSRMADGRVYEWLGDDTIADAPAWLLALVLPQQPSERRTDYTYQPGGNDAYVESAVESELRLLATTAQGGRGQQLNASAFSLGTMVGSGALSRSEAEAGLYSAAQACGIASKDGERETRMKIKRGLEAGMKQPREIPERQSDNTRLVDISRMIANGLAKADKAEPERASQYPEAQPSASMPAQEPPPQFRITPFKWMDPSTLPRREFAFGSHYIRKYVSVTVSPGGLGKTSNSIVEALSMVSGRALTGTKPPGRLRVWLFNAEDPRDEMDRRIMAACLLYNLKPSDIDGYLFLDTGREQELVIAQEDKRTGVKINEPVVEAVVAQIQANGIDVMIVDPFVSTHQVNENDNGAIDKVAKLWAQIADHTNTSIDIVHHLRKVADREATVEDARGAVSLIGAARSVRVLNRMSEDQAVAAGIQPADRFSYFNIHQGKSNLTKMSSAQDWRKLESVALGNGVSLTKPQDHAGVVTEWKWPGSEEIAEGVTQEQRSRIASLLAGQSYKAAKQAKEAWAGYAVMAAMDLDPDVKASADVAGSVLRALLNEGFLTIDERRDERSRTMQKFVVAA